MRQFYVPTARLLRLPALTPMAESFVNVASSFDAPFFTGRVSRREQLELKRLLGFEGLFFSVV
jgi:hypothetical protein